ncbi:MAG: UpxY family transcription antiterminator [Gemmatimonadetes bacterium]|nr:UpxY family transcription antiterminator [Gemmatimonadota bacterium]
MLRSVLSQILTEEERSPPPELYTDRHWYACYTRGRHEKQVERLLRERGLESYLPLIPRLRQWKDRKKVVPWPLFPSYVFGRFTLQDLYPVITTPGVSTVVRANGYPTPISDRDIENVRLFVDAVAATGIEPEPRPFVKEGQGVRVTDGPFQGVEGIVIERRGRKRVLIGIRAIRQGLEIDIDTRFLKPLPGSP